MWTDIEQKKVGDFTIHSNDSVCFRGRWCVVDDSDLRWNILFEAHQFSYTIYFGETKAYRNLKQNFCWSKIKLDVAQYVPQCLVC